MDNTAIRIASNDSEQLVCEVLLHDEREDGYFFDNQSLGDNNLSHLAEAAKEIIEEDIANHSFDLDDLYFDDVQSYQTSDGAVLIFKKYN
ncbi:MAG: hypothetical protein NE327_03715 [Lentisphaeraceae bacterium]|nr:hypothetical protein [Lentisphaeraceae bacterium]